MIMRFIFMLLPFITFSQGYDITKPMLGVVNSSALIGTTINQCAVSSNDIDDMLHEKDIVVVAGSEKCGLYRELSFFKIYINGELNYVRTSEVDLDFEDYGRLNNMPDTLRAEFEKNMRLYSVKLHNEVKEEGTKILIKHASIGITIKDWSFSDSGSYTDGTDLAIKYYNPTKKTIKYIWLTVKGYNPVKDVVVDPIKKTSSITLKSVGPIEPYKTGEYNFEFAWFTDLVDSVKITNIKIQYMDGSVKMVDKPDDVMMPVKYKSLLNE